MTGASLVIQCALTQSEGQWKQHLVLMSYCNSILPTSYGHQRSEGAQICFEGTQASIPADRAPAKAVCLLMHTLRSSSFAQVLCLIIGTAGKAAFDDIAQASW